MQFRSRLLDLRHAIADALRDVVDALLCGVRMLVIGLVDVLLALVGMQTYAQLEDERDEWFKLCESLTIGVVKLKGDCRRLEKRLRALEQARDGQLARELKSVRGKVEVDGGEID